jgi:hypothetical protein
MYRSRARKPLTQSYRCVVISWCQAPVWNSARIMIQNGTRVPRYAWYLRRMRKRPLMTWLIVFPNPEPGFCSSDDAGSRRTTQASEVGLFSCRGNVFEGSGDIPGVERQHWSFKNMRYTARDKGPALWPGPSSISMSIGRAHSEARTPVEPMRPGELSLSAFGLGVASGIPSCRWTGTRG